MKPVDKFGKPIFDSVWTQLCEIGAKLKMAHYREHTKKANLFLKLESGFLLYADMRGTELAPIWEDPCPLFYVFPADAQEDDDDSRIKRNKVMATEIYKLQNLGIKVRPSFYESAEPDSDSFDVYFSCVECEKAFGVPSNEPYCSGCVGRQAETEKRKAAIELNRSDKCDLCGARTLPPGKSSDVRMKLGNELDIRISEIHHTHYIPERTINVCRQCHSKIHRSKDPYYQQFKAEMPRRDFERMGGERTKEKSRERRQNRMWNQRVEEQNAKAAQSERWEKMKKTYGRRARRRTGY